MKVLSYIKDNLPGYVKRPLRELYYRAQGLTTTTLGHEEVAALLKKPNPTILEIGCNDGTDTLALLRVMPEANIYCFEPDPRAIARFKASLRASGDKVRLFEIAVSNRNGQIDFHSSSGGDHPDGWDLSGSIRRPKNHLSKYPSVKFDKTIAVSTRRLDDLCTEIGLEEVDFIWMDVQGAEGDVISGAAKTLEKTRFLYTEYSNCELYEGQPSLKTLLALLPSFGIVAQYRGSAYGDVLLKNKKLSDVQSGSPRVTHVYHPVNRPKIPFSGRDPPGVSDSPEDEQFEAHTSS
jgi:FkbM family methyltransferase